MGVSKICHNLLENMIATYENSNDQAHAQLRQKLISISKEIKANSEIYTDESLIARLCSSALMLQPNNPEFSACLKNFLITYEKKVSCLNILTGYAENPKSEDFSLEEREQSLRKHLNSPFFIELQAAIKARASRMEQTRNNSSFQV